MPEPVPSVLPLLAQDASAPPAADLSGPPTADVAAPTTGEGQPLGTPGGGSTAAPQGGLFDPAFMLILLAFMVFMIVISITSGRKEKKRKAELIASLAKNQKVQLAGGELGTVVDVRDNEVVVKVDENSNTRIRYVKSAVVAVLD